MRRPVAIVTSLLIALYLLWCLRVFWTRPPLDFIDLADEAEQEVVSEWYRSTSRVAREPWSLESFWHAIFHPLAPHQFRPSVTEGGLGGEGTVMLSYSGSVAVFTRTGSGGALEFSWVEMAD